MATKDICNTLVLSLKGICERYGIQDKPVSVKREAGADAPIPQYGAEEKLLARFEGASGECYTSYPGEFTGTVGEVAQLDIENDPVGRSVFIAALNAVMNKYEMADECVHCDEGSE
ncbi:MAG: hypothetical protein FWF83_01220, partial [Clostridiales bacterium]|nr:hypothetical protein [Clostridiales bacterium]